jgi:hypothetical protein
LKKKFEALYQNHNSTHQEDAQDITHHDIGYVGRQDGWAWVSNSVHRPEEKLFSA